MRISILLISILLTYNLYALDKSTYYSYGVEFDANYFKVGHDDKDSLKLFINYRILYDILSFSEEYSNGKENIFSSNVDVELVLTDEEGIIRNRSNNKDTIYAKSFEETNSKSLYYKSYFELNLKNSDYSCEINLIDRFKKKYSKSLKIKKINYDNIFLTSDLLFFRNNSKSEFYELNPYIMDNGFLFDNNEVSLIIEVENLSSNYYYEVEYLKNKDNDNILYNYWSQSKIIFDNKVDLLLNRDLTFKSKLGNLNVNLENGKKNYLKIVFPNEKILPGEYKITISNENSDKIERYFNVIWEDKPLSLDRIDYAIDRMYYILDDNEFETLSNSENKLKDFIEKWKKMDPTPATPYNEPMIQYFTRVDYAFFNFSTLAEKDGARTDRGKVFVLYGSPDIIIDKNIEDKKGFVWEYNILNKKFYFQTVSSGFIKLVKIEE